MGSRPEAEALLRLIGEAIQAERTARGLTVADLAARADTTPSRVSGIEEGRGNPDFLTLDAVVRHGLALPLTPLIVAAERARDATTPGADY
jgi:transcriptional regulator with XRE-family HTH domain